MKNKFNKFDFKSIHSFFNKEIIYKNLHVFFAYFSFLLKIVIRNFTNWMLFVAYMLILSLILLIIPAILNSSPADYWNNPLIQVASFVMPIVAVFASCIALDLFREGVDTGIELIIISKPISRVNFVLVKFSLFLLILLIYALITIFLGILTFAIPKMDHKLVGDLIGGLFTGSFVIGLFFGSLAILISLKFGKNATNMIIILIAIIFNFFTPLSQLFFDTPAKVLRNKGINLLQQNIKLSNENNSKSIVYQLANSFGSVKYVDIKSEYEQAEKETFYNNSFYLNFGNMISSLYNLGGLAPYNNGNISISPINTTWRFLNSINKDEYTHILFGLPLSDINSALNSSSLNSQFIFMPLPSTNNSFISNFTSSTPSYTYLSDPINNQSTRVNATTDLYNVSDTNIDDALVNSNNSMTNLLETNQLIDQITDAINQINSPGEISENLSKIFSIYSNLLTQNNMTIFQSNFENNYFIDNNEQFAKNVFQSKISLFYGLDKFNTTNGLNNFNKFISSISNSDLVVGINNSWLTQDEQWNQLDLIMNNLPLYRALKFKLGYSTPIERNKLIGATLQTFLINQYSSIYLLNLLENKTASKIFSTNLGLIVLQAEQLNFTYNVETLPIIDPSIIVTLMIIISFSLFLCIGFIYYYQDIK